ncbi:MULTISPECIES: hypothetical protein [Phenylobacterium]|uniref:Uncharacterized protein n=1 Tax=Phenylobacterium koreense TaxID=266125 RepID=A0ABV2EEY4_9CAUL
MTTATNIIDTTKEFLDRGYSHDFRNDGGTLHDVTVDRQIDLQDIHVDAAYRFELSPDSTDASNFYAITDRKHGTKGLLIDAFDLLEATGETPLSSLLSKTQEQRRDDDAEAPTRFGLRKVAKAEFGADPDRYVLRIGFPDFPACPFGESYSMLGFDTAEQTYVWLATKILRDDRLVRVPFQCAEIPDND